MAKPIMAFPRARDEREELMQKLSEAPMQHAAALLDLYELAQAMHEHGTLDLMRGLVGAGDDIIGRLAEGLSQPESIQAMRDFVELTKMFARINPDGLCRAIEQSEQLITDTSITHGEPPGTFALLRQLTSRDARRALALLASVLNHIGRGLDRSAEAQRKVAA